jgi:haloalkane dehalogenase
MQAPLPPLAPRTLELLGPFERSRIEIGGVGMHVMSRGVGQPVVALHGNPTWGFLWRKVAAALDPTRFRVVTIDLAGLGYSDRVPDREHTIDLHAARVGGVIDRLGLDDVVFVGQDWGGPIGLRALSHRADRVRGLVLTNTVAGPPRPGFRRSGFHRLAQTRWLGEAVFRGLGFPQVALWLAQADRSSISGDVAEAYRAPLRGLSQNAAPLALARMVPDGPEHASIEPLARCWEFVLGFGGPVALPWGVRDPILGSVVGHLERSLPGARVSRHEAGHFSPEEIPGPIAEAVAWAARGRATAAAAGAG